MAPHNCNSVFLLLAVSYVPKYEINPYDWRITNMPSRSLGIARRKLHLSKISRIFYLQDKYRNSTAAPDEPASSPEPSAPCGSAKPEPDGKGSFTGGAPEPRNRARIRRNLGICHQQVHEAGFDKGNEAA
jgi:hypothetical protein